MEIRTTVKVYILDKDDNVLLVRRTVTDSRRPLEWDIPGGHVDIGETIEEGMLREALEETGINLAAVQLKLASTETKVFYSNLCVHWLFFVTKLSQRPEIILDPHEHDQYTWLPLLEAIEALKYDRQKNALQFIVDNKMSE
jgi:8-oxo-dGTP diphosphatase